MPLRKIQNLLHLLDELVQDVRIHETKEDQERGTDRATNDPANRAEAVEAGRHSGRGGSDDD